MPLGDAGGEGEAEAGAVGLGREEGVEEPLLDRGFDAGAVVGHFEPDEARSASAGRGRRREHAKADEARPARRGDGVGGVAHEVEQGLLDLVAIGEDRRGGGVRLDLEAHLALLETRAEERAHPAEERAGIDRGEHGLGRPGEAEEVAHDAFEAIDLAVDHRRVLGGGAVEARAFAQGEEPGLDRGEGVADLVGDPRAEFAEGGELLLPGEPVVALDEPAAERGDRVAVDEPAHRGAGEDHEAEGDLGRALPAGVFRRGPLEQQVDRGLMGVGELKAELDQRLRAVGELGDLHRHLVGDRHRGSGAGEDVPGVGVGCDRLVDPLDERALAGQRQVAALVRDPFAERGEVALEEFPFAGVGSELEAQHPGIEAVDDLAHLVAEPRAHPVDVLEACADFGGLAPGAMPHPGDPAEEHEQERPEERHAQGEGGPARGGHSPAGHGSKVTARAGGSFPRESRNSMMSRR